MRSLTRRHKLIGGVFGVVTVAWLADMLSGQSGPSEAAATPTVSLVGSAVPVPAETPADLATLIERLRGIGTIREPLPFDQVARDLFVPTASMALALRPEDGPAHDGSEDPEIPAPLPFEARHQLQGILTGRVPLALIDGELHRCGALIDGHWLMQIHRDYVVLQGDAGPVLLRVASTGAE